MAEKTEVVDLNSERIKHMLELLDDFRDGVLNGEIQSMALAAAGDDGIVYTAVSSRDPSALKPFTLLGAIEVLRTRIINRHIEL